MMAEALEMTQHQLTLRNEADPVPLQDVRQCRMVFQQSGFHRGKFSFGAVEHGIDILPGQSGGIDDAVDIDMICMDRPGKCTACRVVPRIDGIGRRANAGATVPAQIHQRQHRFGLHRNTHPNPRRDFPYRDLAVLAP